MIGVWLLFSICILTSAIAGWRMHLAALYRAKPTPRHYRGGGR